MSFVVHHIYFFFFLLLWRDFHLFVFNGVRRRCQNVTSKPIFSSLKHRIQPSTFIMNDYKWVAWEQIQCERDDEGLKKRLCFFSFSKNLSRHSGNERVFYDASHGCISLGKSNSNSLIVFKFRFIRETSVLFREHKWFFMNEFMKKMNGFPKKMTKFIKKMSCICEKTIKISKKKNKFLGKKTFFSSSQNDCISKEIE